MIRYITYWVIYRNIPLFILQCLPQPHDAMELQNNKDSVNEKKENIIKVSTGPINIKVPRKKMVPQKPSKKVTFGLNLMTFNEYQYYAAVVSVAAISTFVFLALMLLKPNAPRHSPKRRIQRSNEDKLGDVETATNSFIKITLPSKNISRKRSPARKLFQTIINSLKTKEAHKRTYSF